MMTDRQHGDRNTLEEVYVSVDIETFKCVPLCIGIAFNKSEAVSIPLLDIVSEKNKNGSDFFIRACWNGFVSNINALFNNERCSSVIYIVKKNL